MRRQALSGESLLSCPHGRARIVGVFVRPEARGGGVIDDLFEAA